MEWLLIKVENETINRMVSFYVEHLFNFLCWWRRRGLLFPVVLHVEIHE